MSERQFTLEEARYLVPWLQEMFDGLAPLRNWVRQLNAEIDELLGRVRANGGGGAR